MKSMRSAMESRYTRVAIAMHWLMAGLIVTNLYLGWRMGFQKGMVQFGTFQLHKSIGITVLLLSVLRLAWRFACCPPAYPRDLTRWERLMASAVHGIFYGLMIAMPLTGWIIVSASQLNIQTLLFGYAPWPHLGLVHALPVAKRAMVAANTASVHQVLAYGFAALIVLHVAAALKHQIADGDRQLNRMLPVL